MIVFYISRDWEKKMQNQPCTFIKIPNEITLSSTCRDRDRQHVDQSRSRGSRYHAYIFPQKKISYIEQN